MLPPPPPELHCPVCQSAEFKPTERCKMKEPVGGAISIRQRHMEDKVEHSTELLRVKSRDDVRLKRIKNKLFREAVCERSFPPT